MDQGSVRTAPKPLEHVPSARQDMYQYSSNLPRRVWPLQSKAPGRVHARVRWEASHVGLVRTFSFAQDAFRELKRRRTLRAANYVALLPPVSGALPCRQH